MLRLVYRQVLTAEAPTQSEAERAGASLEPVVGLGVLSEYTVADPRQTIAAVGTTLEEARAEVHRMCPAGAQIIGEKKLSDAATDTFVTRAPDEESAVADAKRRFGLPASVSIRRAPDDQATDVPLIEIKSVTIWKPRKKGFLGFGVEPAGYEVVLTRKACVERTYFIGWRFVRNVGVELKSVEALQRCSLSDNLSPGQDFEKAIIELRAEGAVGSLALAKLVDACCESRSAAILWPLQAAREAEPTAPLIEALESVLQSDQKASHESGQNWCTPELTAAGSVGWSDRTFRQLKTLASESLDLLGRQITENAGGDAPAGSIMIACARCNEPASFKWDGEFLCVTHYHQR